MARTTAVTRLSAGQNQPITPATMLSELQTYRRHAIRSQSRSDRAIEHLIARSLGYGTELEEPERKRLMKTAQAIRLKVERDMREGGGPDPRIPAPMVRMVETSYRSRVHWDNEREMVETQMSVIARTLPVWPWVKEVKGLAELGLAVIVGEAGDIGSYPRPSNLWKRLGLACFEGTRQGFVPKEITGEERKEAWKRRGYNPARRAEVWAFIDDVLFRAQWRGDKDISGNDPKKTKLPVYTAAHPIGPYGNVYAERKEWNIARGLNPGHADRDARRFMAKRVILDLWLEWREETQKSLPAPMAAE